MLLQVSSLFLFCELDFLVVSQVVCKVYNGYVSLSAGVNFTEREGGKRENWDNEEAKKISNSDVKVREISSVLSFYLPLILSKFSVHN